MMKQNNNQTNSLLTLIHLQYNILQIQYLSVTSYDVKWCHPVFIKSLMNIKRFFFRLKSCKILYCTLRYTIRIKHNTCSAHAQWFNILYILPCILDFIGKCNFQKLSLSKYNMTILLNEIY